MLRVESARRGQCGDKILTMIPSHLPSRQGLRVVALLGCCAAACGDDRDVTRVQVANDFFTGVAAARPDAGSESSVEPPDSAASPDAGVVSGACGAGRREAYEFPSRFVPGASSVDYSAAVLRHVLGAELGGFVESVTARFEAGQRFADGALLVAARPWLESSGEELSDVPLSLLLPGAPALVERRHGDISNEGGLASVMAGSDPVADHRRWSEPQAFIGFEDVTLGRVGRTSFSPEQLVRACLEQVEVNARNRAIGFLQTDPARNALPLHLTGNGRDLGRLIRSFLLGAVAFSRGVDAELDDDVPGAGLLASNERAGDGLYTPLEHAWDMGFGYFGAARDYDRGVRVEDAADGAWFDTNADCFIGVQREVTYGAALGAAAAAQRGAEDFGRRAFDAFVQGRRLIAMAPSALSPEQLDELIGLRDTAADAWEHALAAASVHALNQLSLQVTEALASTIDYSFAEQAGYWSELKGTSLAFQFNRRSPFSAADLAEFHRLIGDAPRVPDTLPPTNGPLLTAYLEDLRRARDILQATYGFDGATIAAW